MVPVSAPPSAKDDLARAVLFQGLTEDLLDELAQVVTWFFIAGGEVLFRRGDPGDSLFIVVTGRLQILGNGRERTLQVIRALGPGENIGELSLLTGEPRSATVRAVRDTQLICLSREQFDGLSERHPRPMMQLARMLATWLRDTTLGIPPPAPDVATVAVIPLTRDVSLEDFMTRLTEVFENPGGVLRLNAQRVESMGGPGGAHATDGGQEYVTGTLWLNELERDHQLVIYEASVEPSAWARRCARQADRILAVAFAGAGPREGQLSRTFADAIAGHEAANVDLVLLHDDGTFRPRCSEAWLALHRFAGHHHVRMNSRTDFARLKRNITGQAIGLVLGGGGARGCAHIGVIRAIEEAGLSIDRLGGTSAGAFIAAQYAYGYTPDEMLELNRRSWVSRMFLRDLTIPLVALLSNRRLKRIFEESFHEDRIEDLWLPFFCVSTNLTRADPVVHREGMLARWVRASLSMPGIVPPVLSPEGDLLVDGGLINNLPVDVMHGVGDGPVIAVDVSPTVDFTFSGARETVPSLRVMWQDLRQLEKRRVPTLARILNRTLLLSSEGRRKRNQALADLYLAPPLNSFDLFDWKAMDRIVEAGYRYATERLAEWLPEQQQKGRVSQIQQSVGAARPRQPS